MAAVVRERTVGGINDFRALGAALALDQLVSRSWSLAATSHLSCSGCYRALWEWLPDRKEGVTCQLGVFTLLHVTRGGCCLSERRSITPPTRTRGSGSRSAAAAAGGGLSSGRCCLSVLRAPPDGEAVSVPQSLFLPEVPSYKSYLASSAAMGVDEYHSVAGGTEKTYLDELVRPLCSNA